jgi:cysteinyl-tRNA synthetase
MLIEPFAEFANPIMLRILNSQSRRKEDFKPLDPDGLRVGMYTCGPTVYDSLHLGHARAYIFPDIVRRYLEHKGYQVRYVTNFTDVDDKIIKRAIAENRDWRDITSTHIDEAHRMMLALNVRAADVYPRATDHIPEMIEIVERLLAKKHAYVAADGDIYFDTASFARYGALSGRKLEEEEGYNSGRVAQDRMAVKRNSGDFVLWKLNKNDKAEIAVGGDRVPRWPSPWGDGRPGWHLECSAMSLKYLGVPFDLHAGGQDLLFPHHEDEKAQTECACHDQLGDRESVRYWVHNAFITVKARSEDAALSADLVDAATGAVKMSKSLGNVKWLREMIWPEGPFDPMAVRMLLLSSHYRSPIVFEPALLDEAQARLDRIYNTLDAVTRELAAHATSQAPSGQAALVVQPCSFDGLKCEKQPAVGLIFTFQISSVEPQDSESMAAFEAAMDDDFNTAGALGAVFEVCSTVNQKIAGKSAAPEELQRAQRSLLTMLNVLGIRAQRAKAAGGGDGEKLMDLLLQVRQDARAAKQFAIGDKVRNSLKDMGYEIEDLPGGKSIAKKK